MTAEKCPAEVELLVGSYVEEGEAIRCNLEPGHPATVDHRAEWTEPLSTTPYTYDPRAPLADATVVITWKVRA